MTSARTDLDSAAAEIVEQVSRLVEGIFDGLTPVLAAAESLLAAPAAASDLDRLDPLVIDMLDDVVIGGGFVAAPDTLADQRFGFEWWTTADRAGPEQLFISLDPNSDAFLDYTRQSWFTVPRDTGRRHINGPYVDYLCTDEYTLTFTIPVQGRSAFAGIVGADVFVTTVERLLLPALRRLDGRAALVNAQGRVVVSTSARQATGSLIREVNIPAWWSGTEQPRPGTTLHRCTDTPLALLVTHPTRE
nr:cache domain-containing protein [Pseudonocardia spinosispora]